MKKIGLVAKEEGVSIDTLRYYEKIGLLADISRNEAGLRLYSPANVTTLRFIRRAQDSGFSLEEIKVLISFRKKSGQAKPKVRELAERKVKELDDKINDLVALRDELASLTLACKRTEDNCPILDSFDQKR